MSSPPPFVASSPVTPNTLRRRKSKFTFKHLHQLSQNSTVCPLRVIAHIDLDAFYAQCEMVRLGVPPDQPLAVQQWQGLIAINYPARAYGLNRHVTTTEAKKLCPQLIMQHVATWKEGEENWAYRPDAFAHIGTHKVSLDPYRRQSKAILALIKDTLPADTQRVEKASIDEVFLDLSAQVHSILMKRYPAINGPPPYDDPTEQLPKPPTTALDWDADALVDLDVSETEDDDPDWDDIIMLVASQIVRSLRRTIFETLHYTCSAGIARNKMLAKLGSGHKKPNSQTVVRNRAVQQFLGSFKFTKIRNLGGKLGDEVVAAFNTDSVKEMLDVPLEQLKKQLGDDTGSWLYGTIRGEDNSEVNPRTLIKSMLSAKSFRPSVNDFETSCKWLRIFAGDIYSRLVEEGVVENKRRPKTINLHHRQGAQTRSKQAPIPSGKTIDEQLIFDLAKGLLAQVVVDGRAWPCANLSLSVGGFEEGPTGNHGIGGFLVRGEEAKAMQSNPRQTAENDSTNTGPSRKRQKLDNVPIQQFFANRRESSGDSAEFHVEDASRAETPNDVHRGHSENENEDDREFNAPPSYQLSNEASILDDREETGKAAAKTNEQSDIRTYFCPRCKVTIPIDQKAEHEDWHFAQDLQRDESQAASASPRPPPKPVQHHGGKGRGKPQGKSLGRAEKGQSRLAFG